MKTEGQKSPMLLSGIILAVLLIAGLGYFLYWINSTNYISTDQASIEAVHVSVGAKMMGRIRSLAVDEGAKVNAGDLLVQLDDTDLRAQEAQIKAAENSALQNLILAKVNLERARNDFDRTKTLLDTGNATREQYDHAAKALDTANAQYSIAQAQVEAAEAQLGVIETQLGNTRILAPISGVIAQKSMMPGEIVQPGQAIYTINDLSRIWVSANFEETKIRLIHPDQPVEVTVDAYPGHHFKARVAQIGSGIVPPPFSIGESTKTTQKIPVKITFDRIPDSVRFLPGMSAEVKVKVK